MIPIFGEVISSISSLGSCLLSTRKFYKKCHSNSLQSASAMHSFRLMGELCLAYVNKKMAMRKPRFKPLAVHLKEDNVLYELGHELPESLSWLLEPPERPRRLPLHKKQQKQEEVTCNRFGVILEWEGVVVEDDDPDLEPRVWYVLSLEEGKSFPPDAVLKEIEGMRTDQAISEVLNWSEDPVEVQRLAARKEAIYQTIRGGYYQLRPGVLDFMNTLIDFNIPIAVTSTRPRGSLEEGIRSVGLQGYFDAVVAVEDFRRGKPEAEMFDVAAECLSLEPDACLVFGNSSLTVESAHSAGMRCVAVASRRPAYELRAADHVIRWLDQLSIVDLQRLADGDFRGRGADMDMDICCFTEED